MEGEVSQEKVARGTEIVAPHLVLTKHAGNERGTPVCI